MNDHERKVVRAFPRRRMLQVVIVAVALVAFGVGMVLVALLLPDTRASARGFGVALGIACGTWGVLLPREGARVTADSVIVYGLVRTWRLPVDAVVRFERKRMQPTNYDCAYVIAANAEVRIPGASSPNRSFSSGERLQGFVDTLEADLRNSRTSRGLAR